MCAVVLLHVYVERFDWRCAASTTDWRSSGNSSGASWALVAASFLRDILDDKARLVNASTRGSSWFASFERASMTIPAVPFNLRTQHEVDPSGRWSVQRHYSPCIELVAG